jgi:PRD1 phage membrane DNA delivery
MTDNHVNALVAIGMAIIGLATLSVIVSNQANTSNVISSATTGFGNLIKAATGPVTGAGGLNVGSLTNLGSDFASIG